jgi:hypothetical protein
MRRLVIDLPLPPDDLWPNSRPHFQAKARTVKRYRNLCHLLALDAGNRARWGAPAAVASIATTWRMKLRKRDPDNCIASLKAALDGLADAKIIANDRDLTILPPVVLGRVEWRQAVPKELRSMCRQIGHPTYGPGVQLVITAE